MLDSLPVMVVALVLAGMTLALLVRTSGFGSTLVKIILGTGLIAALVLSLSDDYTDLIDNALGWLLNSKLLAAAFVGGIILGTLFVVRR